MENKLMLSPAFCLHNGVLVLNGSPDGIVFGMVDDADSDLRMRLARCARNFFAPAEPPVSFEHMERSVFTKQLGTLFSPRVPQDGSVRALPDVPSAQTESAAAALLDSILTNACDEHATDIHIEDCRVQFRVCGVLKEYSVIEASRADFLVRRIKVLANLNVVETRLPQDGQFSFLSGKGHPVYVRVSCVPSVQKRESGGSESVVLRLLDIKRIPLRLDALGFSRSQLETVMSFCELPFGLVLICGATGSGKSTTAGAMLEHIQSLSGGKKKLVSIEDPPEYVLPGVTQIAVHSEQGVSFSSALRSVFRQDPDVIFIGEIRDSVTAQTAVQASLTGHLVLATLHTATASQALMRLGELSVSRAVISSVVCGVIVQELDSSGMRATVRRFRNTGRAVRESA